MRYIKGTDLQFQKETIVTLGKFDGMHKGHQKLLAKMRELREEGLETVVFTFGTSPYAVLQGAKKFLLMTNLEKEVFCEREQIDWLVEYPFTDEVSKMEPEAFVKQVLVEGLHAKYIIVGSDFHFGYQRKGTANRLKELGEKYGYQTCILEKKTDETGREISSTYVRERVMAGDMEKVIDLLGIPYEASGRIVHGKQLGRTFGIPTINIVPEEDKLLPPKGVYASRVHVDGKVYGSISNIGVKPTVSTEKIMGLETYLFDFEGDIYGEVATVELLHFIRPEKKFSSLDELQTQIKKDCVTANEYLKTYGLDRR